MTTYDIPMPEHTPRPEFEIIVPLGMLVKDKSLWENTAILIVQSEVEREAVRQAADYWRADWRIRE